MSLTTAHWQATPVDGRADLTIGDALRRAARDWPEGRALVEGVLDRRPRSWTFRELLADAERVAHALLARFEPGDRVAAWAPNRPEWVLLQMGAALAGLTLVTVNPAFAANEAEYVLRQSRSRGLFVQPVVRSRSLVDVADELATSLPELETVVSFDDWDDFLSGSARHEAPLPHVRPDDPAQIQYTSGTTGFPKGALLAHRGLTLNGRLYAQRIGAGDTDVWVNPMPLFHTAGCGLVTLGSLQTGGTHVLPAQFEAETVLDLFEIHEGTVLLAVPTMLIRLLEAQRTRPRDLSAWRLATLGGAPVPVELVRRAGAELAVQVAIGFGQTESSPYISHTRPDDPDPARYETVGQPLPGVEVKIASTADGGTVAVGETGEICTRGPCVMLGYFDDPAATARALDADGWLHTGDLGSLDADGYLRVQGRLKDLIIRGGENIYPREVEEVLFAHPSVADVAVVGIPDQDWGEVVAAFVQPRRDSTLVDQPAESELAAQLEQHCRAALASYKVPRTWCFVEEFPQTGSGKIQKFALRDTLLAQLSTQQAPR